MIPLIPEYLTVQFGVKLQVTPPVIAMLMAVGLCVAIVWHWYRIRFK